MRIRLIDEVRLENLKVLFERFKNDRRASWPDEPDRGMKKKFAERIGFDTVLLSNIMHGHKNIGTYSRNKIENALGLTPGWLDTDHSGTRGSELDADAKAFQDSVMELYRKDPDATRAAFIRVFSQVAAGKPIEDLLPGE